MLTQQSLREVRNLRILLTGLMNKHTNDPVDITGSVDSETRKRTVAVKRTAAAAAAATASATGLPVGLISSSSPLEATTPSTDVSSAASQGGKQTPGSQQRALLQVLKTIEEAKSIIRTLDQLANQMVQLRQQGVLSSFNVANAVDQMDFSPVQGPSLCSGEEVREGGATGARCVDWLIRQTEASRWLRRTNYRTHAVSTNLASCSLFRRKTNFAVFDTVDALEEELIKVRHFYRDLAFVFLEPTSRNPVLHVQVGDVFQCLISFGNLYPEQIIVRGLDESNCRTTSPSQSSPSASRQGPSSAMSSLLLSPDVQSVAYLLPDFPKDPSQQQQKSATRCPEVSLTSLDLSTPSRYATFQRITHMARCAIQHFADCLALPRCSISLLTWLHSYRNLYTAPCCRCDQLLGQDASLPVCRGYSKPFLPQHEFCRPRPPRVPACSPN
ncbi:hypothetical protein AAHC03_09975 [Spirometra sp. Aus1]